MLEAQPELPIGSCPSAARSACPEGGSSLFEASVASWSRSRLACRLGRRVCRSRSRECLRDPEGARGGGYGRGGDHSAENLRLYCKRHNALLRSRSTGARRWTDSGARRIGSRRRRKGTPSRRGSPGLGPDQVGVRLLDRARIPRRPAVAVLPFEKRLRDPDSEYLSDGVAETLIDKLSLLPDLKVIGVWRMPVSAFASSRAASGRMVSASWRWPSSTPDSAGRTRRSNGWTKPSKCATKHAASAFRSSLRHNPFTFLTQDLRRAEDNPVRPP